MHPLELSGSDTWARTRDPRINSPLLYQLSYVGITQKGHKADTHAQLCIYQPFYKKPETLAMHTFQAPLTKTTSETLMINSCTSLSYAILKVTPYKAFSLSPRGSRAPPS